MSEVLTSLDGDGICTITVNRPEALNAINGVTWPQLDKAVRDAALDPGVRVVVMTGAGRAFSAGGDIKSFGTLDPNDAIAQKWAGTPVWGEIEIRTDLVDRGSDAVRLMHAMPKPTIAMWHGAAAGMGAAYALACDFRIASDAAFMATAYARIGLPGDGGITYYLHHLVGPTKARELMWLGDRVDAAELLRLGIVSKVVPEGELMQETMALARRLAAGSPVATRLIKQNLLAAETESVETVIDKESYGMARAGRTEDFREALSAMAQKRPPVFKGI